MRRILQDELDSSRGSWNDPNSDSFRGKQSSVGCMVKQLSSWIPGAILSTSWALVKRLTNLDFSGELAPMIIQPKMYHSKVLRNVLRVTKSLWMKNDMTKSRRGEMNDSSGGVQGWCHSAVSMGSNPVLVQNERPVARVK